MKILAEKADDWIETYLEAPDMKTLKKWAFQTDSNIKWGKVRHYVMRFRNSLPIVSSRRPDGRATSSRASHLPRTFRSPAWVACDLGFIRLRGKNYGNFFLAVQTLTKQVFVQKINSKKWVAIRPAILQMLKTPGFQQTKR
jgi:hypothetical protein